LCVLFLTITFVSAFARDTMFGNFILELGIMSMLLTYIAAIRCPKNR